MAIPTTGPLSLYATIGVELGVAQTNVSLRGMSQTAGFTAPDAMSEFYGYSSGPCTDIVNNYNPFGTGGLALYQLNGNANDVSGSYNGTATNVTYGTGVFGQAGVFNGSSSYVDLSNTASINYSNITLSLWFKSTTQNDGNGRVLIAKGSATNFVIFEYGGIIAVQIKQGVVFNSPVTSFTNNQWYYLTFTISGGNTFKFYLNGAWQWTGTGAYPQNSENTQIGRSTDPYWQKWNGSIDQVRIFNEALTPLEIEALYTEELCICEGTVDTVNIFNDNSCIALYPLDGNVNDLSGNYSGIIGTIPSYQLGKFDLSIKLPSAASKGVELSNIPNRMLVNSVSFWFKKPSIHPAGEKIMFWLRRGLHTWIGFDNNQLVVRTFNGSTESLSNPITVNNNQWYHFCLVSNGSIKSIYLNGANYQDYFQADFNTLDSNAKTWLYNYDTSGISSTCELDQARIFNKALSAGEVITLYNETPCT